MQAFIPSWVFGVLLLILLVGYRQSHTRVVRPGQVATLAVVMLGLSLSGVVTAFGLAAPPLLAWLLGMVASVGLGAVLVAPRRFERRDRGILIPGSWVPLGLMLGIFCVKVVLGFASATAAPFAKAPWFIEAISVLLGLFSGAFTARALAVRRFALRSAAA